MEVDFLEHLDVFHNEGIHFSIFKEKLFVCAKIKQTGFKNSSDSYLLCMQVA